jgi:putative transposase
MLILEGKLKGKTDQYEALNQAIRTGQFVQNKCLRLWMDSSKEDKINRFALNKYCAVLASNPEYPWASKLNSMARQAHAERAWAAISRFYANCKNKTPGKKGFPKFKKFARSVEYKTSGWSLSQDRKVVTFTDGFNAGSFRITGAKDLKHYSKEQIKRLRVVRRADGYYAQFAVDVDRQEVVEPTGTAIGIDVGLTHFYTDSNGEQVENPKFLRKSEKRLKKIQRRLSKRFKKTPPGQPKVKQSNRYHKQRNRLARKHLQISRQRKDHAVKLARCVVKSNDFIAYEDLKVSNMVKNHCLAKSISDAGWRQFREWVDYFGIVFGKHIFAVAPHYTTVNCSGCSAQVKKSLSVRTHICLCGTILDRDHNAAINILNLALNTAGHVEIYARGQSHLCQLSESLAGKWSGGAVNPTD